MDVYTYITYTIDSIKRWLNEEGNNDARILHALETVAQKAADLAVVTTVANSKELHKIFASLQAFEAQFPVHVPALARLGFRRDHSPVMRDPDIHVSDTWDTYSLIAAAVDLVNNPVSAERINDVYIFQAFETAAQKAADLAVIATATNSKELHEILTGLKAFARQLNGKYQLAAPE